MHCSGVEQAFVQTHSIQQVCTCMHPEVRRTWGLASVLAAWTEAGLLGKNHNKNTVLLPISSMSCSTLYFYIPLLTNTRRACNSHWERVRWLPNPCIKAWKKWSPGWIKLQWISCSLCRSLWKFLCRGFNRFFPEIITHFNYSLHTSEHSISKSTFQASIFLISFQLSLAVSISPAIYFPH